MPQVGTTYIVGVIREKEKRFLTDTEYTRIIEAPSTEEAIHVLNDTPYGVWLNGKSKRDVFEALTSHLQEELLWLGDVVDKRTVIHFITARYNALDIVNAVYNLKCGEENLEGVSPLSSFTKETLYAALWHNQSWDQLPSEWAAWVKQAHLDSQKPDWTMRSLLESTEAKMWEMLEEKATTPLTKELIVLGKKHMQFDKALRLKQEEGSMADIKKEIGALRHITPEITEEVENQISAISYEKGWDEEVLAVLQKYRLKPSGYDPIIAYWYGKELEARQLRILLSAKMGGVDIDTLHTLKRTPYTTL